MNRIASMAGLLALGAVAFAQEPVYRNLGVPTNFYGPGPLGTITNPERGDEITLAPGTGRKIVEMTVLYITDVAVPQGDETFKIRFYQNDGPAGAPGTLIWQSPDIPAKMGWRCHRIDVKALSGGGVVVPDTFTWTFQMSGTTGQAGDRVGLSFGGPPELGSSDDTVWYFDPGTNAWVKQGPFGTPPYRSFMATFWAVSAGDGVPATPYDNTAATASFFFATANEFGDHVVFEGPRRTITKFEMNYQGDILTPQGDEMVVLTLYAPTDPSAGVPYGRPGTVLWQSAPTPVMNGVNLLSIDVPNIAAPADGDIIWTLTFSGMAMTAGDQAGPLLKNPPNPGTSHIYFWMFDPATMAWGTYWFGDPTPPNTNPVANFDCKFTAAPTEVTVLGSSMTVFRGVVEGGNLASTHFTDSDYLVVRSGFTLSPAEHYVDIRITGASPSATPANIKTYWRGNCTLSGFTIYRYLRRASDGAWILLGSGPAPTSETTIEDTAPAPASQFVDGSGNVTWRVSLFHTGLTLSWPPRLLTNEFTLRVQP